MKGCHCPHGGHNQGRHLEDFQLELPEDGFFFQHRVQLKDGDAFDKQFDDMFKEMDQFMDMVQ